MAAEGKKSRAEYNRRWRQENPEKVKAQRERHSEKRNTQLRKWRERIKLDPLLRKQQCQKSAAYHKLRKKENPAYAKKSKARCARYYKKAMQHPEKAEKIRERSRNLYHSRKNDPERYQAYLAKARDYRRSRKQRDPDFAIRCHLRSRLIDLISRGKCTRNTSALNLTGATIAELRSHIERQFKRGMSWRNYGVIWHIDHIIPCAEFDLTSARQQAICFNYLNLSPLWAKENLKKSNRILEDSQMPLGI
jgi:hypothetical protein